MPTKLEADYLIIGAGAMGMAFTDTLIAESNATAVIVDRNHQPGGHWNTAYPFVRLHQPSSFYGVNSRPLGSNTIDSAGWNKGLYELATNGEVCAYFDQVMQQHLLPSGRVSFFPMCEYEGGGHFHDFAGKYYEVAVNKRIVDATYMRVTVPSMRPPPYEIAPDVTCIPPNELPKCRTRHDRYVIVGAGKTGMDTCLFLLRNGIAPDDLTWIMPRDSWLQDRANIQPGQMFGPTVAASFMAQNKAIAEATSIDDLFGRLNAAGRLLRLDGDVRPSMYRCATVSRPEFDQLRRLKNIIRLGRVTRIDQNVITLDGGTVSTAANTLHIDCSADGLAQRPALPVFDGKTMTLQAVRTCQQVFSAAFIAHVEASYQDDTTKNRYCTPVPHPNTDLDWLRTTANTNRNQMTWLDDDGLLAWLDAARLNGYRSRVGPLPEESAARARALGTIGANLAALNAKLEQLLSPDSVVHGSEV